MIEPMAAWSAVCSWLINSWITRFQHVKYKWLYGQVLVHVQVNVHILIKANSFRLINGSLKSINKPALMHVLYIVYGKTFL